MEKSLRVSLAGVTLVVFGLAAGTAGRAEEPSREFLEALRSQAFYDTALEYLEQLKQSPLASEESKKSYLYERGLVLMDGARVLRDLSAREKQLDDAQASLKAFIAEQADHPKVLSATSALGSLAAERGRLRLEAARQSGGRASDLQAARRQFEEAITTLTKLEPELQQKLDQIPKVLDSNDPQQAGLASQRDQLRADLSHTMLMIATVHEDMADTYSPEAAEFKTQLGEALQRYDDVYEKYRTRMTGQIARQSQGRAAFKLGKIKDAISYYTEILDQGDSPEALRMLKVQTMPLMLECYLHDSEEKYAEAIRRGQEWLTKARRSDERKPEYLRIRLLMARAHQKFAAKLERNNPKDKQILASRDEARKLALMVARNPSDDQKEAQQLIAELGGPESAQKKPAPKSFQEAQEAGQEALEALQSSNLVLTQLPQRLAAEKDPKVVADLQKQLDEARQSQTGLRADAMEYFRQALALATAETPVDDVNYARHYVAYLRYVQEDYLESSVLAEFVARRFPDSSAARQCAKIALASLLHVYSEEPAADKPAVADRVIGLADYITTQWAGTEEASEALATLIPFTISSGNVAKAEGYLDRIPADSPKRGDAELKTGQAMWDAYLRGMRELRAWEKDGVPAGVDLETRRQELNELKARSQRVLQAGIQHYQQSGANSSVAALAVLALAQVYIDLGQADQAIALLEDPKIGPLPLIEAKNPVVEREGFVEDSYKTALRAYITAVSKSADPPATIDKAKAAMEGLRNAVGDSPEGVKRLVAIYFSLAQDLQKQLQLATPEARKPLTAGFEVFLRQIREEATELNVLNWVADTYQAMAKELSRGGPLSADSKLYFDQAIKTYDHILEKMKLEPAYQTHIRMQKARALRELGSYREAIDAFEAMLRENNLLVALQVEAARTLEEFGATPGNEAMYDKAIMGDRPDPKTKRNVIWGWGRISQMTAQKQAFNEVFYESRYHLALCRFRLAMSRTKPDERKRLLDVAEKDVLLTAKLYKDLGGPAWRSKFDLLMLEIQRASGKQPVGLQQISEVSQTAK